MSISFRTVRYCPRSYSWGWPDMRQYRADHERERTSRAESRDAMKPIRTLLFLPTSLPCWLTMALVAASLHGVAMAALADDEMAQTIVHMLDYVGVDYPGVVQDGNVVNAEEYAEQHEFATQVLVL